MPWPRNDTHFTAERETGSAILIDERLAFCRLTQLGFLRLLTNKHVMLEEVMSPGEAWQAYRDMRLDRRIGYLAEPNELAEMWQAFTDGR